LCVGEFWAAIQMVCPGSIVWQKYLRQLKKQWQRNIEDSDDSGLWDKHDKRYGG